MLIPTKRSNNRSLVDILGESDSATDRGRMPSMGSDNVGLSPDQLRRAIASLSSPDTVESPFGDLTFFDGVPTPATSATVWDALDLMRGIEVFLNAVPGASLVAMRRGLRRAGVTSPRIIGFTDPRANSRSLF